MKQRQRRRRFYFAPHHAKTLLFRRIIRKYGLLYEMTRVDLSDFDDEDEDYE